MRSFFPAAFFAHGWIFDRQGPRHPDRFRQCLVCRAASCSRATPRRPMTGISRSRSRSQCSARAIRAISPGTIRRRFCSWRPCWRIFPMRSPSLAGWSASLVPYLAVMRAIVGRPFGLLLAAAFPVVLNNALVGQNGFLTASLIGGTLYLMPVAAGPRRHLPGAVELQAAIRIAVSAGADRGLAVDGICHARPLWRLRLALLSWFAFGTESWQAFFHWMPMFSQAFLTEGRAPWWQDAKRVRAGTVFRRRRTTGLGVSVDHEWRGRGGAGTDVAQPYQLFAEGRGARHRHAADHALSVSVRS